MGKKYEKGDLATFYFIIVEENNNSRIQGWTDEKVLAESYLEFHKCKKFKMKSITKSIDEIYKILEENVHDEITIHNLIVKDRDKPGKVKTIPVPVTETEYTFIREETNTFMTSMIDYGYLNSVIPYLKKEYIKALKSIFLLPVINHVVHNKPSELTTYMQCDELGVLFRSFPENFGC